MLRTILFVPLFLFVLVVAGDVTEFLYHGE